MMNWTVAIAPDVLKSRLQTGTVCFLIKITKGFWARTRSTWDHYVFGSVYSANTYHHKDTVN